MKDTTYELIQEYYAAFNQKEMERFLNLLAENIIHDINQGPTQVGKKIFEKFMDEMNRSYEETIQNIIIMTTPDGKHASAKFMVSGKYLKGGPNFPQAKGQSYQLPAATFFEVKNHHITRVTTYYNLQDWLKQVSL